MSELDLDRLFTIAQESPALDAAEAQLKAKGKTAEAAALNKWQQDAGVQVDLQMAAEDGAEVTAQLRNAFEPVTFERTAVVLSSAYAALDAGPARDSVAALASALKPPAAKPAAGMKP